MDDWERNDYQESLSRVRKENRELQAEIKSLKEQLKETKEAIVKLQCKVGYQKSLRLEKELWEVME